MADTIPTFYDPFGNIIDRPWTRGTWRQQGLDSAWLNWTPGQPSPVTTTPETTTPTTPPLTPDQSTQVVPGAVDKDVPGQINVVDYGGQVATNPSSAMTTDNPATTDVNESMHLSTRVPDINENAAGTNIDATDPKYNMDPSGTNAQTAQVTTTAQAAAPDANVANTYQATEISDSVANQDMTAAQGQVSQNAQVNTQNVETDVQAFDQGIAGEALKDFASLSPDQVDPKATVQGQLEALQSQFVDTNGNPKIPSWAQATARNVQRIASFSGMTGTAATAALSQALLEASLPIAKEDAKFFQTLTLQNLSNEQEATLNRANVLSRLELQNMDARMSAATQNAQAFLQMDLANLSNEQQASVLNTQNRVQAIFEDSKQVNAQRLFTAQSQNDMDKFYDELSAQVSQFNTSQMNGMQQFNVSEANGMSKFNADLENQREQFYKNMQYNIDVSNAKWRQTVTTAEAQMDFEAAATDVKNMVGISNEQLNQLWDRSDSMLQYLWTSTENEATRKHELTLAAIKGDQADAAGTGSLVGSIVGAGASAFFDWLF